MTGVVVWFTGLPASGKSTLARSVAGELQLRGVKAVTLDSDEIRAAIFPTLGYDDASRETFYAALARLAAVLAQQGHVVLVPATAHRRTFRDAARAVAPKFILVYVDTPLDECQRRDHKGVYQRANAPGVGVEYEAPNGADIEVRMGDAGAAAAIARRIGDSVAA